MVAAATVSIRNTTWTNHGFRKHVFIQQITPLLLQGCSCISVVGIALVGVSWGRRPTGGVERDLLWRVGSHDYRGCYDPSSVASMLETQKGWWVNSSLKMQDLKQRENPHFSLAWKAGKSGVAFWLGDFLGEDALLLRKDSPFCSLQVFSFFHEPTHLEEGCLFYALCHSNANAIKKCTDRSTQNNV